MLIDTHCHLTSPDLAGQIDAVIARAVRAGVTHQLTVATTPADARQALGLLSRFPSLLLAAGIHPHEAGRATADDLAQLERLHRLQRLEGAPGSPGSPGDSHTPSTPGNAGITDIPGGLAARLRAVGEAGLDFHYDFAPAEDQERIFRAQIELALAVGRPLIIHARSSEARVCEVLAEYPELSGRFVFHCFSADPEMAARILGLGGWLSFTGVVTFRNATAIQAAAQSVPAERIMIETDAPYLSPEPHRKVRPNEPALVVHTARFLAELRGVGLDELAAQTTENARRFFGIATSGPEAAPGKETA